MHTSGTVAVHVGARLVGPGDVAIERLDTLSGADERTLTFVRSAGFARELSSSRAGSALVTEGLEVSGVDTSRRALLFVEDADVALVRVLELFAPRRDPARPGVHASAVVEAGARVDASASVGPLCVVGAGAVVGAGVVLVSQVSLGRGAMVGAGSVLHAGVSVGERCVVGRSCILHGGVVVGADGFGFVPAPGGRGLLKVPHIGHVEIGDEVEIGANSCVDRGKFGATVVGSGTKIDNLVQVGHNCQIGRCCVICGQVGLAGSVTLGDGVILAGQVAVADNLTIGAGARVGAASGVVENIPAGETWLGTPAMPAQACMRMLAATRRLPAMLERLRELERLAERLPGGWPAS